MEMLNWMLRPPLGCLFSEWVWDIMEKQHHWLIALITVAIITTTTTTYYRCNHSASIANDHRASELIHFRVLTLFWSLSILEQVPAFWCKCLDTRLSLYFFLRYCPSSPKCLCVVSSRSQVMTTDESKCECLSESVVCVCMWSVIDKESSRRHTGHFARALCPLPVVLPLFSFHSSHHTLSSPLYLLFAKIICTTSSVHYLWLVWAPFTTPVTICPANQSFFLPFLPLLQLPDIALVFVATATSSEAHTDRPARPQQSVRSICKHIVLSWSERKTDCECTGMHLSK